MSWPRMAMGWLLIGCGPKHLPEALPAPTACAGLLMGAPATKAGWPELVDQVQRATHPELDGVEIELVQRRSTSSYLWANLRPASLLARRDRRIYRIYYTADVFDGLSRAGQVAILTHELEHIRHYTHMRAPRLIGFGLWYSLARVATYERWTDDYAVRAGCGQGLRAYRLWQYDRVSPRVERKKRRNYLTPEEIGP